MWASVKRHLPIVGHINKGMYTFDVACLHLQIDIGIGQWNVKLSSVDLANAISQ